MNTESDTLNNKDWSVEDDEVIIQLHRTVGTRWKEYVKALPSVKTDNAVKNRWNSTLRRVARYESNIKKNGMQAVRAEIENQPLFKYCREVLHQQDRAGTLLLENGTTASTGQSLLSSTSSSKRKSAPAKLASSPNGPSISTSALDSLRPTAFAPAPSPRATSDQAYATTAASSPGLFSTLLSSTFHGHSTIRGSPGASSGESNPSASAPSMGLSLASLGPHASSPATLPATSGLLTETPMKHRRTSSMGFGISNTDGPADRAEGRTELLSSSPTVRLTAYRANTLGGHGLSQVMMSPAASLASLRMLHSPNTPAPPMPAGLPMSSYAQSPPASSLMHTPAAARSTSLVSSNFTCSKLESPSAVADSVFPTAVRGSANSSPVPMAPQTYAQHAAGSAPLLLPQGSPRGLSARTNTFATPVNKRVRRSLLPTAISSAYMGGGSVRGSATVSTSPMVCADDEQIKKDGMSIYSDSAQELASFRATPSVEDDLDRDLRANSFALLRNRSVVDPAAAPPSAQTTPGQPDFPMTPLQRVPASLPRRGTFAGLTRTASASDHADPSGGAVKRVADDEPSGSKKLRM